MLFAHLLYPLAPIACYGCHKPGTRMCGNCLRSLVRPYEGRCYRCYWGRSSGACCIDCARTAPLLGVTAIAHYQGQVAKLIYELKHVPDERLASLCAALLVRRLLRTGQDFDVVVPIPTSPRRYHERGYNQTELITRQIVKLTDLPQIRPLLRTNARHQIGRDRSERLGQISGVFTVARAEQVRGGRILLVDDVMTTGATLDEAATALLAAGAASVWAGVVARA